MDIPIREGYITDGTSKHYTKYCKGCPWYRKIDAKELCGKGRNFVYLYRLPHREVTCTVKDKNLHVKPSAMYLDRLVLRELTVDEVISGRRS